jgi:hypothetical protein
VQLVLVPSGLAGGWCWQTTRSSLTGPITSALRHVVLQFAEDFSRPFRDGTGAPHGNLEPPTIVGVSALISHENPRSSVDAVTRSPGRVSPAHITSSSDQSLLRQRKLLQLRTETAPDGSTSALTLSCNLPDVLQVLLAEQTYTSRYMMFGVGTGISASSGTSMSAAETSGLPVVPIDSERVMSPQRKTWLVLLFRLMFSQDFGVYVVPWIVSDVVGDWSVYSSGQRLTASVTQPD